MCGTLSPTEEYKAKVPGLIRKHGGEYLVRGSKFTVVEGDWEPKRLVVLRFPDIAAAQGLTTIRV